MTTFYPETETSEDFQTVDTPIETVEEENLTPKKKK